MEGWRGRKRGMKGWRGRKRGMEGWRGRKRGMEGEVIEKREELRQGRTDKGILVGHWGDKREREGGRRSGGVGDLEVKYHKMTLPDCKDGGMRGGDGGLRGMEEEMER